jgi:glutamyl-tRNA reductase
LTPSTAAPTVCAIGAILPDNEEIPRLPPVFSHPSRTSIPAGKQLDCLVVASATVHDVDTEARELLAVVLEGWSGDSIERVLLHTCHRVELIAFSGEGRELPDLPQGMQRSSGLAAAERVMLVAGGFDSVVLGEEQVLGQVRDAYQAALAVRNTGPVTNELLRRAIRFGKRVQSFAQPIGDRSLADRAARWVEERLAAPSDRPLRALVVGTGEMGRALATHFAALDAWVTVASRSGDRAEDCIAALPHRERHSATAIAEVLAGPLAYDIVAIAVRGGKTRLEPWHLDAEHTWVVDLSAPSAVTAGAAAVLGGRLLDLDRLGVAVEAGRLSADVERRLRAEALAEAEAFASWLEVRSSGDSIAMLRAHGDEVRRRHLERLRLKSTLDEEQAAAVEAMTVAMFGELLHGPTVRLRHDPDAAAHVREVFGIE